MLTSNRRDAQSLAILTGYAKILYIHRYCVPCHWYFVLCHGYFVPQPLTLCYLPA